MAVILDSRIYTCPVQRAQNKCDALKEQGKWSRKCKKTTLKATGEDERYTVSEEVTRIRQTWAHMLSTHECC